MIGNQSAQKQKNVAVIVYKTEHLQALVRNSWDIAETHQATLTICWVSFKNAVPDLFSIPEEIQTDNVREIYVTGQDAVKTLLKKLRKVKPDVLCMALDSRDKKARLLDERILPLLHLAHCDVCIFSNTDELRLIKSPKAIIPFADDQNTRFAIRKAFAVAPELNLTAIKVISPSLDVYEGQMIEEEIAKQTKEWRGKANFSTRIVYSEDAEREILKAASDVDFILVGASKGNRLIRGLQRDPRHRLAETTNRPIIILRENQGRSGIALYKSLSVINRLLPILSREDRVEAYRQIRRGGRPTRDFYTMIALSAAIASLGLLLDSAAVIIGAMLVAPLMSAIIGMGLAIIHGDLRFLLLTFSAVIRGSLVAILTGWCFGFVNITGDLTEQILQRTDPSIHDLGVALISGIAAAYAMCRKNVSSSLPGVAIAVALVPPLATVGLCISLGYFVYALGAFKLFLTNLFAIVFAGSIVFALLGFKPNVDATQEHKKFIVMRRTLMTSAVLLVVMSTILFVRTIEDVSEYRWETKVENEFAKALDLTDIEKDDLEWTMRSSKNGFYTLEITAWTDSEITQQGVEELKEQLEAGVMDNLELNIMVVPVKVFKTQ